MKKLYINYSEFELICWDTDGENTNISINLTTEQAEKICEVIGLIGFTSENNETVGYYRNKNKAQ